MKKLFAVASFMGALAILLTVQSAAAQGKLEGAWKPIEIIRTVPTANTLTTINPGLLIFTKEYYSWMLDSFGPPRQELPENSTDAEITAAFRFFWAFSGAYEVKGTILTMRPIISKNPGDPAGSLFFTMEFNIQGNILTLVDKGSHLGPAVNPAFTIKLTRLE